MCWINKVNETFVANTDIHVFKIARIKGSDDKVYPYFMDVSGIEYVENKTYKCGEYGFCLELSYVGGLKKYVVNTAMHSYSIENIRLFSAYNDFDLMYTGTYKTTPQSKDVIVRPQYYRANHAVIMLCTIPKGTRYAINAIGEIVSDEIHVDKIIRNPFTFNKDSSLSKRSLEKINKILDNWEKCKHNE
jgi:hypothetical protein